nr:unnamed protein product [Digitaria exilis]
MAEEEAPTGGSSSPSPGKKPVMVVGIDDSEHSYYALEWTLQHFFAPGQPQQYKLVVLTAKPPAASVIDVGYENMEGDARSVICEAVDRHHAEILVIGCHGYSKWKRAVLGSVSDYCTHHAHCSVMVVKRPKHKH